MQDRPPTACRNLLTTHGRTVHVGQKQKSDKISGMSAKPLKADIGVSSYRCTPQIYSDQRGRPCVFSCGHLLTSAQAES